MHARRGASVQGAEDKVGGVAKATGEEAFAQADALLKDAARWVGEFANCRVRFVPGYAHTCIIHALRGTYE